MCECTCNNKNAQKQLFLFSLMNIYTLQVHLHISGAFTHYTCNDPDSLQCASFKIPKLYDISGLKTAFLCIYSVNAL